MNARDITGRYVAFNMGSMVVYGYINGKADSPNEIRVVELCAIGQGGWSNDHAGKTSIVEIGALRILTPDALQPQDDYAGFVVETDGFVTYEEVA